MCRFPISRGSLVKGGGELVRIGSRAVGYFHTSPWTGFTLRGYRVPPSQRVVYLGRHRTGAKHMPRKPELRAEAAKAVKAVPVTGELLKNPVLASYLSDMFYDGDDGKEPVPRQPSSLMIFPGGGYFRVILKDASAGVQLRCQVDRWEDILPTLELLLTSTPTPWEPDLTAHNPRKGGKK